MSFDADLRSVHGSLSDGFERELLAAGVALLETKSPVAINCFALVIRELVRHVLSRLSPDNEVTLASWFTRRTAQQSGPTRRERLWYATVGGLELEFVDEELGFDVEPKIGEWLHVLNELSALAHVEEARFNLDSRRVWELADRATSALRGVLDQITAVRSRVAEAVTGHIDRVLLETAISDGLAETAILSTHTAIESLRGYDVQATKVGATTIELIVKGEVEVQLAWGSSRERAEGEGAEMKELFPFTCRMAIGIDFDNVRCVGPIEVDTSSWFE